MSIGEICNRNIVTATQGKTALDAAVLMREHHVGAVVVVDDDDKKISPIGIVTDRDIAIELVAKAIPAADITLGDMVNQKLQITREDDDILTTTRIMSQTGVRRLPVVNEQGKLIGIVSMDDLLEVLITELSNLVFLINQEQRQEQKSRLAS